MGSGQGDPAAGIAVQWGNHVVVWFRGGLEGPLGQVPAFLGFPGCRDDPSSQKLRLQTRSPADFAFSDFEFEMSHLVIGLKVLYCN